MLGITLNRRLTRTLEHRYTSYYQISRRLSMVLGAYVQ